MYREPSCVESAVGRNVICEVVIGVLSFGAVES